MREILFRGKRIDNGKWVEGELLHDMKGRPWIYWTTPKELPIFFLRSAIVKSETVGEYTGLTDKNGKKIFEGDIVRGKDCIGGRREGSVFYDNYNAMYMIKPNTKSEYREANCLTSLTPADAYLEVIGNIHDNPELLEVEE